MPPIPIMLVCSLTLENGIFLTENILSSVICYAVESGDPHCELPQNWAVYGSGYKCPE